MNDLITSRHATIIFSATDGHKALSVGIAATTGAGEVQPAFLFAHAVNISIRWSPERLCMVHVNLCFYGLKQCGGLPYANPVSMPSTSKLCWV